MWELGMSVMFRPPMAALDAVSWKQMLGFGQGNDPFFARVRSAQIESLRRHVPFNLCCMLVNVMVLASQLQEHPRREALWWWIGCTFLLGLTWLIRSKTGRRRKDSMSGAGRLDFWLSTLNVFMFAVLWSVMVVMMMPAASPFDFGLIVVMTFAAAGATGFASAIMPVAAISSSTVLIGSLLLASRAMPVPLILAMMTFLAIIARGSIITSFAMMARLRVQEDLAERNEVVRLLLNEFEANGSDWLIEVDHRGRLTHVTARLAAVFDQPAEALSGRPFLELLGADDSPAGRAGIEALLAVFKAQRPFRDLVVPAKIGGETHWWSLSGSPKQSGDGRFSGFRGVGRDVTEVRRSEQRIAQLARFDPLTGLANRTLFREMLEDALARGKRGQRDCALLFLDLDRFKPVNDTFGHVAGDQLLVAVAERLRQAVAGGATLARLGGDEFAVVLPDVGEQAAATRADALVAALAQPFEVEGQPVQIGCSIGWSMAPVDGDSIDLLLKAADLALYEAKSRGRGVAIRYHAGIRARAEERRALESALPGALARGELSLAFQPVVDSGSERIVAFEALLRWTHPELGTVGPDRFVPVAEETGLIVPIGHWVLEEACRWAATWPETVGVAVNVSPAQMDDPQLVDVVAETLARHGIAPERLELEITERLFLHETPETIARLAALNALGVRFALDDFGTGYSSLNYLHKAAFSRIKIDRSFVSRVGQGGEATAIIEAIVKLARSLQMTTTAEGTETRAEFETCRDLGCAQVQGYLFGRPMPPEAAGRLVEPYVAGVRRVPEAILQG
jgi:diguanylate cyclase (GGDEF)-like protein/PAS domain S-box-containing protein